jgi:superoxide dismutase, Fe-Mn family
MSDTVSRRDVLAAATAMPFLGGLSGMAVAATAGMESYTAFQGGKYVLPTLPYPYNALEPAIDAQTMKLHHSRHHQSYVNGLNTALERLGEARKTNDFGLVKHWERELAFHGSGHFLHTLFWANMAPKAGGTPSGALAQALNRDFGSFKAFQAHFGAASKQVEASGWGILAYEPHGRRLLISQAEKHQNLTEWGVIPLLALDVWEHAYYLKYQNDRSAYVDNWWSVVNWPFVQQRFEIIRDLVELHDKRLMNPGGRR